MLKILMLLMMSITVYLGYLVFENESTGLKRLNKIEATLRLQQKENTILKSRNEMLEADIKNLHQNLSAVEELARKELGLIQRDETFYYIIGNGNNNQKSFDNPKK